jgi:preprotein translocase SecE subunit
MASEPNRLVTIVTRTRHFLTNVQVELRKVTWPTRPELMSATRKIIILSIALGLAIGLVDALLNLVFIRGVDWIAR